MPTTPLDVGLDSTVETQCRIDVPFWHQVVAFSLLCLLASEYIRAGPKAKDLASRRHMLESGLERSINKLGLVLLVRP